MLYTVMEGDLHTLSRSNIRPMFKYADDTNLLVPAYPGCPGKEAVKWLLLLLLLLLFIYYINDNNIIVLVGLKK